MILIPRIESREATRAQTVHFIGIKIIYYCYLKINEYTLGKEVLRKSSSILHHVIDTFKVVLKESEETVIRGRQPT